MPEVAWDDDDGVPWHRADGRLMDECPSCAAGVPIATESVSRTGVRDRWHLVAGLTVRCLHPVDRLIYDLVTARYRAHTDGTDR